MTTAVTSIVERNALGGTKGSEGERSEPERTAVSPSAGRPQPPDPELDARPTRRKFTAEYKAKILAAADECKKPGEIGALLRREGLYSSNLEKWRAARRRGELAGLGVKRGPKSSGTNSSEIAKLKAENERLRTKLRKAEMLIDLQKKRTRYSGSPCRF